MNKRTALAWSLAGLIAVACSPDNPTVPKDGEETIRETGIALDLIPPGQTIPFVPVASSATCSVGGRGGQQLVLPQGYIYSVVASEGPGFGNNADMNTMNEGGPNKGRFLYRTHEVTTGASVSVTDLVTGASHFVAQRADWERFDGIVWTPWNTILASEEVNPSSLPDPAVPQATAGLTYEIDPATGAAVVRPALGAMAHEGMRIGSDGNVYEAEDDNPGYIFKFVPDRKGDLSSGQLYALKITNDLGDRTGSAEWIPLDRNAVQVNAVDEAAAKGATGYGDPEDLEIGTSTGDDHRGNHTLFVAISAENRVIAVNLNAPGSAGIVVSDYVRKGVNAPADFDSPDNVALDKSGNLYITEDPGGSAPTKTLGDDVWFAPFNQQSGAQSLPIQRFFSITDCNAEPTGLYMSISNRTLFFDIQHRGGDGADLSVAIQRLPDVSFSRTRGH
jgi:hypothetical protein